MPMTPQERSQRARIAAHAMHARGGTNTEAARAAFDKRFLDEVDPDRTLPDAERTRRAKHARAAYFARLSYKSARARQAKTVAG